MSVSRKIVGVMLAVSAAGFALLLVLSTPARADTYPVTPSTGISTTASTVTPGDGGSHGSGGGLAFTGAQTTTTLAVGAAALAIGGGLVLVSRRRSSSER